MWISRRASWRSRMPDKLPLAKTASTYRSRERTTNRTALRTRTKRQLLMRPLPQGQCDRQGCDADHTCPRSRHASFFARFSGGNKTATTRLTSKRPASAFENRVTDGRRFQKPGRAGRSSMHQHQTGTRGPLLDRKLGCSKDELTAAIAKVGNSADAVRGKLSRTWGCGRFLPGGDQDHRRVKRSVK